MSVYKITNVGANKCLNIYGSNDTGNTLSENRNITIWSDSGTPEQLWFIPTIGARTYIRTYLNYAFGLNAYRSGTTKYNCDLHTVAGNEIDAVVDFVSTTGGYKIRLTNYSSMYLTVDASTDGTNVYWAAENSSNYQVWKITSQNVIVSGSSATVYATVGTTPAAALNPSQINANATYIFNYLRNSGFTKNAACAVLGEMEAESGMNPGIWEKLNIINDGYGLIQWTPATKFLEWAYDVGAISPMNSTTINNLAQSNPKSLMDIELTFLNWDCGIRGNFSATGGWTFSSFKSSTDSASCLAEVLGQHYVFSDSGDYTKGAECATKWYNYF